jgi:DNA-binding transcriptional MerR regulator
MKEEIQKRYYSIGEIAERFGVNASLIRFWETEFDMLQPKKNKKGDRQFTQKDIDCIQNIYHLVKEKGFTLQGARETLKAKAQSQSQKAQMIESLQNLKSFLIELRANLEKEEAENGEVKNLNDQLS